MVTVITLVLFFPLIPAAAFSPPNTAVSWSGAYMGSTSDGGSLVSAPNPQVTLQASTGSNATIISTEYKIGDNGTVLTYTAPFKIWGNHSHSSVLHYRSNSTSGLEGWKSLSYTIDADAPVLAYSNANLLTSTVNNTHYLVSSSMPFGVQCEDNGSNVASLHIIIGSTNLTVNASQGSITAAMLSNHGSGLSNGVSVLCIDGVGLNKWLNFTLEIDSTAPTLVWSELGPRSGSCISPSWKLMASSTDTQTSSSVQYNDGGSWASFSSPMSFAPGFNGTVSLRAIDGMGLVSSTSSLTLVSDASPPNISAVLSTSNLTVSTSDSCGVATTYAQFELLNGTRSAWYSVGSGPLVHPAGFNREPVRAHINSTDAVGNSRVITTGWNQSSGSLPVAVVSVLSGSEGGLIEPMFRATVSPSGYQTLSNWTLFRNNVSVASGSINNPQSIYYNFSHNDHVRLRTVNNGAFGATNVSEYIWTVDGINNHQVGLFLHGAYNNSSGLVMGPSGQLSHGLPGDNSGGVGGQLVQCSTNGIDFSTSQGARITPVSVQSGSTSFIFGCRSVDRFGNQGPIAWMNGTLDLVGPSISILPSQATTLSPSSSIVAVSSDLQGVERLDLRFGFSNSTVSSNHNMTVFSGQASVNVQQLFSTLGAGTLTLNVSATDELGNTRVHGPYTWSVNTTHPMSGYTLLNGSSGTYLRLNGSELRLHPPASWHSTTTFTYTLTKNNLVVFSGNNTQSVSLFPSFSSGGDAWLNLSTIDASGQQTNQTWQFFVDASLSTSPAFQILGANNTVNGTPFLGPNSAIRVLGVVDDNAGVGEAVGKCSLNNNSLFDVSNLQPILVPSHAGLVRHHTLKCYNQDLFGNTGPLVWLNFSVDHQLPVHSIQPNTAYVSLTQNVQFSAFDNHSTVQSVVYLNWSNGTSNDSRTVQFSSSYMNSSVQSIFGNIGDGLITVTVHSTDLYGNRRITTGSSWLLSTQQPAPTLNLRGNFVGTFLGGGDIEMVVSASVGGSGSYFGHYEVAHSNGSTLLSGNFTSTSVVDLPTLTDGDVTITLSITDTFGNQQNRSWMYTFDGGNNITPFVEVTGPNLTVNQTLWVGPAATLQVNQLADDANGVGYASTQCSWDNNTWFAYNADTVLSLSSSTGQSFDQTLRCYNLDLLGNQGPLMQFNHSIDHVLPNVQYNLAGINTVSPQTVFQFSALDDHGVASTVLNLGWSNGQSSWSSSHVFLGTSWNVSFASLANNLTDGSVSIDLTATDSLGNQQTVSGLQWALNTTQPYTSVAISGVRNGQYLGAGNITFLLTPQGVGSSVVYTLASQNVWSYFSGSTIDPQSQSVLNLSEGQVWLNLTTTDQFNRTQHQSLPFIVDLSVNTTPVLQVQGSNFTESNTTLLGPFSTYSVLSASDDSWGVGLADVSCSWNGGVWFNVNGASISPPSISNTVAGYSLRCRSVDLLGNTGPVVWHNGSLDATAPSVSFTTLLGVPMSASTQLNFTCSDNTACELLRIQASFSSGNQQSFFNRTLSGNSSSVLLSQLLNVNTQGSVSFIVESRDRVGNHHNHSTSSFVYLHTTPTANIEVLSQSHGHYISENLSISITPSSGWGSGISLNFSLAYNLNNTTIYSGLLNQSTSVLAFQNLSEGQVWMNSSLCNALNNCTYASSLLTVDATSPTLPGLSLIRGNVMSNGSMIGAPFSRANVTNGLDWGAGIAHTNCSSPSMWKSTQTNYASYPIGELVGSGQWVAVSCSSVDRVGHTGPTRTYMMYLDQTTPSINSTTLPDDRVVVAGDVFNASCSDTFSWHAEGRFNADGVEIASFNSSGIYSTSFLSLLGSIPRSSVTMDLSCTDFAGNQRSSQSTFEWLPYLQPSNVSIDHVVVGNVRYISLNASLVVTNPRSDITQHIRWIEGTNTSDWSLVESSSFTFSGLGSDLAHDDLVMVQIRVSRGNSNLSNITSTVWYTLDTEGPSLSLPEQVWFGNSTLIPLSASDEGAGFKWIRWNFDNGSNLTSTNLANVLMEASAASTTWLTAIAIDQLGNEGPVATGQLYRDLDKPVISIEQSNPGYLSENGSFEVSITTSSGLQNSSIRMVRSDGIVHYLSNYSSNFSFDSADLPAWMFNTSSVNLIVEAVESSQLRTAANISLVVDTAAPEVSFNTQLSSFMVGLNTSNHSRIALQSSSDTSLICWRVGINLSALASSCLPVVNNTVNITRSNGGYVLQIHQTDYAGNTNVTTWFMTHHVNGPAISHSLPEIVRPAQRHNITYSGGFGPVLETQWNGALMLHQQGELTIPAGSGNASLSLTSTNLLGLSSSLTVQLVVDSTEPSLTLDGLAHNGTKFGTNSTLYINASDTQSSIQRVIMVAASSSTNCSATYTSTESPFNVSGTLATLLNDPNCDVLTLDGEELALRFTVHDGVGNVMQTQRSARFYGRVDSPQFTTSGVHADNGEVFVGPASNIACLPSGGAIQPELQLVWTGSGSGPSGASFSSPTSSGVLTCILTDEFGNTATSALNLTLDGANPDVSIVWPTSSHEPFVRSNGPSFIINASDQQVPVPQVFYCIGSSACQPTIQTNGSTSLVGTHGWAELKVRAVNAVGLETYSNQSFFLDNQAPSLNLTMGELSLVNGSTVYVAFQNSSVTVQVGDHDCFDDATLVHDQGTVSLGNWTNDSVAIPGSSSYAHVFVTDCVGHQTHRNFSVQPVVQLGTPTLGIRLQDAPTSYISGSDIVSTGNTSLRVDLSHPIPVAVNCSSPNATINCVSEPVWNRFTVTINNATSGNIELTFSDALGNLRTVTMGLVVDSTPPTCHANDHAVVQGSTAVLSSTLQGMFSCQDNLHEVVAVSWQHQTTTQHWSLINGMWVAPVPGSNITSMVMVDTLGNVRSVQLSVQFDQGAPTMNFMNLTSISLDEERAQRNGRFDIECVDDTNLPCFIRIRQTSVDGTLLFDRNYTRLAPVSLEPQIDMSELRVWITVTDAINQSSSHVFQFDLDDERPEVSLMWRNGNTGARLMRPIVPDDGLVEISGMGGAGLNQSQSTFSIRCHATGLSLYSSSITSVVDLSEIDLGGCLRIGLNVRAVDHAQNTQFVSQNLTVDYLTPEAIISVEDGCGSINGLYIDTDLSCNVVVEIHDDEANELSGNYLVTYLDYDNGSSPHEFNTPLVTNATLPIYNLTNRNTVILVSGTDAVGRPVTWSAMYWRVNDTIELSWSGLSCRDGVEWRLTECPLRGDVFASTDASATVIGLSNSPDQAQLVTVEYNFTNKLDTREMLSFTDAAFDPARLPDGVWELRTVVEDGAGRVHQSTRQFTFDNTAPAIVFDETTTVGYDQVNSTVLRCGDCRLSYRIVDLTFNTHNLQNASSVDLSPQMFEIETNSLRPGTVLSIAATDQFGRRTDVAVTVLPFNQTSLDLVELHHDDGVSTLCIERAPTIYRNFECLWHRENTGSTVVPLAFDSVLDAYSRDVDVVFTADSQESFSQPLRTERFVKSFNGFDVNVLVEVRDEFSNIKPLNITLIQHDRPWSEAVLFEPELSDHELNSSFDLRLTPPPRSDEFLLLRSDAYTTWSCEVRYGFKEVGEVHTTSIDGDACFMASRNIDTENTLTYRMVVNHFDIKNGSSLYNHPELPLFNLAFMQLTLTYSDVLGVEATYSPPAFRLEGDDIVRSSNRPPQYLGGCALGVNNTVRSQDGFLQSDNTLNLEACEGWFADEDGIYSTVWNMSFSNSVGEIVYSMEIECRGTYFPQDWAFQNAFDSGRCTPPKSPFPSGVFDVKVQPKIRDMAAFDPNGNERNEPVPVSDTGNGTCMRDCWVVVSVPDVNVYPSFNPALEVKNAQEFVESWSAELGGGFVLFNLLFGGILVFLWRRSRTVQD